MSNPVNIVNSYVDKVLQLCKLIEDLRGLNDVMSQDPTIPDRYFADPAARKDIATGDVTAAKASMVQIIFAYDSGNPPQKAALFKLIP